MDKSRKFLVTDTHCFNSNGKRIGFATPERGVYNKYGQLIGRLAAYENYKPGNTYSYGHIINDGVVNKGPKGHYLGTIFFKGKDRSLSNLILSIYNGPGPMELPLIPIIRLKIKNLYLCEWSDELLWGVSKIRKSARIRSFSNQKLPLTFDIPVLSTESLPNLRSAHRLLPSDLQPSKPLPPKWRDVPGLYSLREFVSFRGLPSVRNRYKLTVEREDFPPLKDIKDIKIHGMTGTISHFRYIEVAEEGKLAC